MTPAYSLLKSEFNDFLFAPIGEEKNSAILTVLSALARLGMDPWQESARLAQLSKAMAIQRLTTLIAGLPEGRWASADAGDIAARLVDLLPAKRVFETPARTAASGHPVLASRNLLLLAAAILGGLVVFAIADRVWSAPPAGKPVSSTTSPAVPLKSGL